MQHAPSHQHKKKSACPMVSIFVSWDKKWGKYPKNTLILSAFLRRRFVYLKFRFLLGKVEYLNTFNFRAPLIFAQERCAKIKGARKRPIFAHLAAQKLKGARNRNQSQHVETSFWHSFRAKWPRFKLYTPFRCKIWLECTPKVSKSSTTYSGCVKQPQTAE